MTMTATSFPASVPTAPVDTWLCWCGYVNLPGRTCVRCYHEPPAKDRRRRFNRKTRESR